MLPAALKYAVIDQIKLNSSSFAIHNEKNVITFNNLIVPDARKTKRNINTKAALKYLSFYSNNNYT